MRGSERTENFSILKSWPKRYTLVSLCFFAAFICYIDRVNISVAAIAMKETFGWSETVKGLVLASFFVGYLPMQVAGGWLAYRLGGKLVLGFAVVWWSLFTILTPAAVSVSITLLIITRILLGLGEAVTFPASFVLLSKWVPGNERSRAVALLLSGAPLGVFFAFIASGWIVEHYGWPAAFYLFGVVGLIWVSIWYLGVFENPHSHPRISSGELKLLKDQSHEPGSVGKVPWKALLSRRAVWALIINHFCVNWSTYMLIAWLPSYFRDAQGVSITNAGLYSAVPWLTSFLMMNVAGWIADTLIKRGLPVILVRKLMQTIGLLGTAIFLLLASQADTVLLAMLTLSGAVGLLAFSYSGFGPNALEIAPRYSGILAGITNTVATLPGILGIVITGWLVDVTGTYVSAFAIAAGLNIFGAIVWLLFASSKPVVD